MTPPIAIVGMACRYPDARSPAELWENALAGRRAFRRMPPERLCAEGYYSPDLDAPDRTYSLEAALIENYEFDRVRFNISGSTYRSTDLAHWLALDIAAQSLADAGFSDGPPRESTGVYVGNTLTGEFSRANTLRLRWPYVKRVLAAALTAEGWPAAKLETFLESLEQSYKQPFPPVGEDTLAGGLSNTIAGRISNYFDLKGGGYTVDGACASSLLAAATACSGLAAGDIDVALAGGVDVSLDPFELVGFAKSRALATDEMRIFDARSAGFWPGEGCGFVVLMRLADAQAQQCRIYATIRGWGISSDGGGGISRPELEGQLLAIRRAYCRAGFPPSTVAYFEGHGTGTSVGDATEIQALSTARREADPAAPAAAIGSIKANIGHTKAAAGVAGLIKAAIAVHTQIVPPTVGCQTPHPELARGAALRTPSMGGPWPAEQPLRAGVSAMGFGGINAHVALEGAAVPRRPALSARELQLLSSAQDAELFLFTSADQLARLAPIAGRLSRAELTDMAVRLAAEREDTGWRAAVVASSPRELESRLAKLELSPTPEFAPRIGFLFPGQGSGLAQPAIVKTSLAALQALERLSLTATVAVGHSLGELTALCWAGALSDNAVIELATARDRIMSSLAGPVGTMAGFAAGAGEVQALLNGEPVVVAGLNSPRQTVISGERLDVERVRARAHGRGIATVLLPVSHAFHSPLVAGAAGPLAAYLAGVNFRPLNRRVVSTVTGVPLDSGADLRALLLRQLTSPVRFAEALTAAREDADLWIEVGAGSVLTGLTREILRAPVVPVDADGRSVRGLLEAVAAAFTLGAPIRHEPLFADRLARPFRGLPQFFSSPCEQATAAAIQPPAPAEPAATSALDLFRQMLVERTELPAAAIKPESRLLGDLHLNSITVAELVTKAARQLGVAPPVSPIQFAGTTVGEVVRLLESAPAATAEVGPPPGVDSWVRPFTVELVPRERPATQGGPAAGGGIWQTFAAPGHPLAAALPQLLQDLPSSGGVLVCLPPDPGEEHVALLLEGARAALACRRPAQFLLVQRGAGAASLARTLHLEATELSVCVIDVPDHPRAPAWIAAEARAAKGYIEAHYDGAGHRYEPVLRLLNQTAAQAPLDLEGVLLVTGGGKGITAECALALARSTGMKLAVLGRSRPAADRVLAANLERMKAAGLTVRYLAADVTGAAAGAAVREIEESLGPITAILHGAGVNTPRLLVTLDESAFRATLAPKLQGLRNLLNAIDPRRLRLLVAFGSVIARTGMPGEADYAVANEWLARTVDRWRADHPHCRCLTIEWSIWSGLGMGERLGRVDALMRQGITPIAPDEGVRIFQDLVSRELPGTSVIVTSRFGDSPALRPEDPGLPFARFLERPRVYYPRVELIADAELSTESDPYLRDHVFQGTPLLPAVVGLEAMAQAAAALSGSGEPPTFEDVCFSRPVNIPEGSTVIVRIAALARSDGAIAVALRSSETAFQVDHFRAICRRSFPQSPAPAASAPSAPNFAPELIAPGGDLYGSLLFQNGRFRRLRGYRHLHATECIAEITPAATGDWFARYLPSTFLLGDPGARDALIHSVQACIPHATILPAGVERIVFGCATAPGLRFVHARERSANGPLFVYDLDVTDAAGALVERWEGLQLRVVHAAVPALPWAAALLGPYLERRVGEFVTSSDLSIAVGQNVDFPAGVRKRPDGKPEANGHHVSRSHAGDLGLVVASTRAIGCDVELVLARAPEVWRPVG